MSAIYTKYSYVPFKALSVKEQILPLEITLLGKTKQGEYTEVFVLLFYEETE